LICIFDRCHNQVKRQNTLTCQLLCWKYTIDLGFYLKSKAEATVVRGGGEVTTPTWAMFHFGSIREANLRTVNNPMSFNLAVYGTGGLPFLFHA